LIGSSLVVLNAIQPVRLFARLIKGSELIPDAALTLTRKRYNEIQSRSKKKKIVTPLSFEPRTCSI